ncbi:RICIN domain-containing protein [Streptomyces sp. NPDC052051]|uniref:RICIN domain-containing protein n=1 Tax=Streptomyces sp. NPDC052051 TaxID=3154649 RepID=UPI0034141514
MIQRLTPTETKDFKRKAPEQFARMQKILSRSSSTVAPTADRPALAASGDLYRIVNVNSNKCLAIGSSSTANGAHAIQWDCLSNSNGQVWFSDGYRIVNANSGKCLAIGSSSTANGAHAIQWDCLSDSYGQLWYAQDDWDIINWNSGLHLAIGSSSTANGAHAIQWEYTGSNGQAWYYY